MKKKSSFIGLLFLCGFLFWFVKPEQAQAATNLRSIDVGNLSKEENRIVGGITFERKDIGGFFTGVTQTNLYAIRNNKKILLASVDGKSKKLGTQIVTNGKTVYYSVTTYGKSLTGRELPKRIIVYRTTVGKKSKQICSFKAQIGGRTIYFNMLGIYGKNIIYSGYAGEDIYSYSMRTGKHKKLSDIETEDYGTRQYNQYIYVQNTGSPFSAWISIMEIINAKNGKVTKLSSYVPGANKYDIIGKKVYYLEQLKKGGTSYYHGRYYPVALKRCNLDGSHKKTLVDKITIAAAGKITFKKNSIIYYDQNGKRRVKQF